MNTTPTTTHPQFQVGSKVRITMKDGVSRYDGVIIRIDTVKERGEFNHKTYRFKMVDVIEYAVKFEWENGWVRERTFRPPNIELI